MPPTQAECPAECRLPMMLGAEGHLHQNIWRQKPEILALSIFRHFADMGVWLLILHNKGPLIENLPKAWSLGFGYLIWMYTAI